MSPKNRRHANAATVVLVREARIAYHATGAPIPDARAGSGDESAAYMRAALPTDDPREHFAVLALDSKHRVIGHYLLSVGTLDATLVHPREVFRFAMLAGAAKIVIGHTHPSGNPTPSTEDLALTRRIVTGGTLLGIACVDHVIVGCNYGGPLPAPALSLRSTNPAIFVE